MLFMEIQKPISDARYSIADTAQTGSDSFSARPGNTMNLQALLTSFGHAFAGLGYLFRTQRNARIHALIAACALALGIFLPLARWEWLALVLTCALVIATESINTAIEATVDLVTNNYHPLARIAKDVSAGAVMFCALTSVVMGCLIFIPHLWPLVISLLET